MKDVVLINDKTKQHTETVTRRWTVGPPAGAWDSGSEGQGLRAARDCDREKEGKRHEFRDT